MKIESCVCAAAFAVALSACGGDDLSGSGESSSSTTSSETTGETMSTTTVGSSGIDSSSSSGDGSSSSGEGSSSSGGSSGGSETTGGSSSGSESSSGDGSSSSTGVAEALCDDDVAAPGEFCFQTVTIDGILGGDRGVEVLDVDGDGDLDIVTGSNVIRADGAGGYVVTNPLPGGPFIAAGQLDADDVAEVVIPDGESLGVFHLDADGAVASTDLYTFSGDNGYAAKVGDLVGGPDLDVAVVDLSSGEVQVYDNEGGVLSPLPPIAPSGSGARHVEIADLNDDGNGDLIVSEQAGLSVLLGTGAAFGAATTTATSGLFTTITIGDVNNDDIPDIIGASPVGAVAEVLYGDGDGGIASSQVVPLPVGPRAVGVGDFNSDGIADLVAVDYEDSTDLVVLLGEGDQNFAAPEVIPFPTWAHDLAVADMNDDGVDDVVAYGSGIGILLSTL